MNCTKYLIIPYYFQCERAVQEDGFGHAEEAQEQRAIQVCILHGDYSIERIYFP